MNTPNTHRSSAQPKPTPVFRADRLGSLKQFLNLIWLLRLVLKVAPSPALLWAFTSLIRSLVLPINLWITKYLVDAVVDMVRAGGSLNSVSTYLTFLLAGLFIQRLVGWIDPWLSGKFQQAAGRELTRLVIVKAPRLSLEQFEHTGYYDELTRAMSQTEQKGPDILDQVMSVVRNLSSLIGYGAVLWVIHPFILMGVVGLTGVSIWIAMKGGQDVWSVLSRQTFKRRLADYYGSILIDRNTAKEARLYDLKQYLIDRCTKLYWDSRNELRREAVRVDLKQFGTYGIAVLASIGALYYIAVSPSVNASPGLYTIFFQAVSGILDPMYLIVLALRQLGESSGYASDLRHFLDLPEYSAPSPDPTKNTRPFPKPLRQGIVVKNVTYTYPGSEAPALRNLNLEINAGEKVAIVGENGSGKTTFVRLLLGLYRPDSGVILADGIDYQDIEPHVLYRAYSAVMQSYVRYHLSLAENIALSQVQTEEQKLAVNRAAVQVGADITDSLPQGYDTLIGPEMGGVDLSGGQWQRVALARAFFRNSEVIVLDEPTAALDPMAELAIFERFRELAAGRTALMIAHRLGMARLADRILVFRGGTVIEEGTHDQLLREGGEYAEMFESQARWYR